MANASYVQTSFLGGEWSQDAQGQSALPEYKQALNVSLNALPLETGAHTRRPGLLQVGLTRAGAPGVLRRFDFSEAAPYNVEFTDGHARFWSGPNLVTTNDDQTIASISSATPAVVTTALAHGWATNDQVFFKNVGAVGADLLGRMFAITVLSSTTFSIADAVTGVGIVGTALTAVTGTVARALDIATPYSGGTWAKLRAVQTERRSVLLNGTAPQVLALATAPGLTSFAGFSLSQLRFQDGPYLDPYKNSIINSSGLTGNVTLTLSFAAYDATASYSVGDYVTSSGVNYKSLQNANLNHTPVSSPTYWAVVSGGDPVSPSGFVTGDIGRHVRLFSEPADWVSGTAYSLAAVVSYNGAYWAANTTISTNLGVPPGVSTSWSPVTGPQYARWTWGRITGISGAGLISNSLSGATNIGNITGSGGLAALFDGTTSKQYNSCATTTLGYFTPQACYGGRNFTGASAQIIDSATVFPAALYGFSYCNDARFYCTITLNLRAKQTAPSGSSDGTLLGTTGSIANTLSPVSIQSNDKATAWNYVWIELILDWGPLGLSLQAGMVMSQIQFYTPNVANGSVVTLQIAGQPLLYSAPIKTWRAGAYSDVVGWPTCGTYHEGRLWLSGAITNRVDGSVSNDLFNFAPTGANGVVADNNAIAYTFNSADVNSIFWMESDKQGIICGSQAGEWLIDSGANGGGITPSNCRARRHTINKCANIPPARCENTLLFIQKSRRRLNEYFADVFSGKFASPNLSFRAAHLTGKRTGMAELAYQQDVVPVVWCRDGDGKLLGMSYKRNSNVSSQPPDIMAWHQHAHGGGRTMSSIVVGPSSDGLTETLACITTDGALSYVELMGGLFLETDAAGTARFVDAGVVPAAYAASQDSIVLYGLYGLEGKTVTVSAAGLDCGDYTVANGRVTVPFGDGITAGTGGGLFTKELVDGYNGALPVVVGFTYTSRGQLVRPASMEATGARNGPGFGKERRSHRLVAQLRQTAGISFGTVFGKLKPALFKSAGGQNYTSAQLYNGIFKSQTPDDYSLDSMLCWEVTRPYPATVVAYGAMIAAEDQ